MTITPPINNKICKTNYHDEKEHVFVALLHLNFYLMNES